MVASLLSALLTAFLKAGSSGILIVIGEHFLTSQFDIFTPFSDDILASFVIVLFGC